MALSATLEVGVNLCAAWLAGSVVGYERTYNGRAAGLRTHGLVALASAAAMSLAYLPALEPNLFGPGVARLDPSRLAQGVMTGLGFLGAGVIFKEGVSVQGLTTAAALWTTAAIGLLCGMGLYAPALATTAIALLTLIGMRVVERLLPARVYAMVVFRFPRDAAPDETQLRAMLGDTHVSLADFSYALTDKGRQFEYRASLEAGSHRGFRELAERLRAHSDITEFELDRVSK